MMSLSQKLPVSEFFAEEKVAEFMNTDKLQEITDIETAKKKNSDDENIAHQKEMMHSEYQSLI